MVKYYVIGATLATLLIPRAVVAQYIYSSGPSGSASGQQPLGAMIMQGNNSTVTEFNGSGISVIPNGSFEFNSFVTTSLAPSAATQIQRLLPYSILLKNTSEQAIIAYTFSWTSVDSTGQPSTSYQTVCDDITLKGLILPQSADIVTSLGPANVAVIQPARLATEALFFQTQRSVTIALEAVMFQDGSVIGRDGGLSVPQIKAVLRSEYDLYKSVLTSADPNSLVSKLQQLSDTLKPGGNLDLTDPFQGWYGFYSARLASRLLKIASDKGVEAMLAFVQTTFQEKTYPPLVVNP
jgi:hypothetical protein